MIYEDLDMISVAQAAHRADRSKTVIRRWINEGWLPKSAVYIPPGRNSMWLIDRVMFEELLPKLLSEMAERKGGRGHRAVDAHGNLR